MSWTSEQNAIRSRFSTLTTIPAARLAWDGLNGPVFNPPTVNPADPAAALWARLGLAPVPRSGQPLAIGETGPDYREGLIIIQHFAPAGLGEDILTAKVDESNAIFHRATFSNVICRDADAPDRVGLDESGEWFQINAVIPYYIVDP